MPEVQHLQISHMEAGSKLLRFLERRLGLPASLLLKWIRTGQVRVDGARSGPYHLLRENQMVRVPPYQAIIREGATCAPFIPHNLRPKIIFESEELLVVNKPAGLPAHSGTAQPIHLAGILAAMRPEPFPATAAHRLDRQTSGLVIAAKSVATLKELHHLFSRQLIRKTYMAWVGGLWRHEELIILEDYLAQKPAVEGPKMEKILPTRPEQGRKAITEIRLLQINRRLGATLLEVRPLSGRKHQIRAQLAARGFPIIGDAKYQGRKAACLMLHAGKLELPDGQSFEVRPDWPAPWTPPTDF